MSLIIKKPIEQYVIANCLIIILKPEPSTIGFIRNRTIRTNWIKPTIQKSIIPAIILLVLIFFSLYNPGFEIYMTLSPYFLIFLS